MNRTFHLAFIACNVITAAVATEVQWPDGRAVIQIISGPITVSPQPSTIALPPLRPIGNVSAICFVVSGQVPNAQTDATFDALRASLTLTVQTSNGKTVLLPAPKKGWKRDGVIAGSDELSACVAVPDVIADDELGRSITVSSERPMSFLGVYWESTNSFDRLGR